MLPQRREVQRHHGQPIRAATPSSACSTDAARTAPRSPGKRIASVCVAMLPSRRSPQPNQTRPTGFSALPPPGPATPLTATDRYRMVQGANSGLQADSGMGMMPFPNVDDDLPPLGDVLI